MHPPDPRATWGAVAEAYDRQARLAFAASEIVSAWLADAVAAGPGRTILDVAAGPGYTTLELAARGASVICTDNAPGMVELARRNAGERGQTDIEFRVMDATAMDLTDEGVDGIVCRYGLMLMPDPARVLAEAHRVLARGGVLAYAVWTAQDENPWAGLITAAAERNGHDVPWDPKATGGMFSLADAARNRSLLEGAGFRDIGVEELSFPVTLPSFGGYWAMRLEASTSTQMLLSTLTSQQAEGVRAGAAHLAEAYARPDGSLAFTARSLAVRAAA